MVLIEDCMRQSLLFIQCSSGCSWFVLFVWLDLRLSMKTNMFDFYKVEVGTERKLCLPCISYQVIVCIKWNNLFCNEFNIQAQSCHNNELSMKAISWLLPKPVFAYLWLHFFECTQQHNLCALAAKVSQLLLPQRDPYSPGSNTPTFWDKSVCNVCSRPLCVSSLN